MITDGLSNRPPAWGSDGPGARCFYFTRCRWVGKDVGALNFGFSVARSRSASSS